MKNIIIIILVAVSLIFSKNECGADSAICQYENLYQVYQEKSKTNPTGKSLLVSILIEILSGDALESHLGYIRTFPEDYVDGLLVFFDPIVKVESTEVINKSPGKKLVKRVFVTKQKAFIEGEEFSVKKTYFYTLEKKYSKWKISKVTSNDSCVEPILSKLNGR